MTNSDHRNQPNSTELKTYLVTAEPDYSASIQFQDGEYEDFPGNVNVGRYEARSSEEALHLAEKDFLSWGCSQEYLDDIYLEVIELAA